MSTKWYLRCVISLAYKTRFHLIFRFPAWSKRNIILTVTAQGNHFLHSEAINKHFFRWKLLRIGIPEISIENILKLNVLDFTMKQIEWQTVKTLIGFTVLSVLSVLILIVLRYTTFKTVCKIFREKNILTWFLKVKKILAVFWNFVVTGWDR